MKVLDCTLRDGGYYNQWDFDDWLVSEYLSALSESGVSVIELGFRSFATEGYKGAFAYTGEDYLKSLHLPENMEYAVMLDAKTILDASIPTTKAVDALFTEKANSSVTYVRIAAHYHEIPNTKEIAQLLNNKGYSVIINLMQSSGKSDDLIVKTVKEIEEWGCISIIYFADSLGNMDSQEVCRLIDLIKQGWTGEIGIHAHNNMGRALDNSLTAIEHDVLWVDSTITGMGRGAGNTTTESLLSTLSSKFDVLNPSALYDLVIRHFEPLKAKYGWGTNFLYFLGAQYDIHPTYIQNLLSDTHIGKDEVVGAINYLIERTNTNKYDGKVLESALNLSSNTIEPFGENIDGIFRDREMLIIANGPSTERHIRAIELYIKKFSPVVISVNIVSSISEDFVDYYCISHNLKFLADKKKYTSLVKPLIYPKHRFKEEELIKLNVESQSIEYGISVQNSEFSCHDRFCVIPFDLTSVYALALGFAAKARRISLVGFDGYQTGDKRQEEMIEVFRLIEKYTVTNTEIRALTETSYPVKKGSLYESL